MAVDFNKALDVKAKDVAPVPVPPVGHYIFQVTKVPSIDTQSRWNRVTFPCRATGVFEDADDVDQDELRTFGKVTSIMIQHSFLFDSEEGTEADLITFQNRVKRFCGEHLGIEDWENKSLRQLLNESAQKKFVGQLTHRADSRDPTGETMQAQISRTAPVEA